MSTNSVSANWVVDEAKKLGFALAGVTSTLRPPHYQAYLDWLDREDHGNMAYMASDPHVAARRDARSLLASAKSAIAVGMAYAKPTKSRDPRAGTIASYAAGRDYHQVMKPRLKRLANVLQERCEHGRLEWRACVDTAPILERDFAVLAGLGFVGKNTMLIAPGVGSYVLLGVLLTNIEFSERPHITSSRCGSCTACLDACPTSAFRAPFVLDSRRCISYLTIEHRGVIPSDLRPALGNHVYGCDVCQQVCPYNSSPAERAVPDQELAPSADHRRQLSLEEMAQLGSNQYKRYVGKRALRRASRKQWLRNVATALGNSGDPSAANTVAALMTGDETVAEHARWAFQRLTSTVED